MLYITSAPACAVPSIDLDHPAYLIAVQRYGEAADELAGSAQSDGLQTLCARATLLLYCDKPRQAFAAFEQIRRRTAPGEPLADYGEALCALLERNPNTASEYLDRCLQSAGYAERKPQIDLARAAVAVLRGNTETATKLCQGNTLPLAQEVQALNTLRTAPQSSAALALLQNEPWSLPGRIPCVVEPPGLRAVALAENSSTAQAIEPSLALSSTASLVLSKLLQSQNPPGNLYSVETAANTNASGTTPSEIEVDSAAIDDAWQLLTLQPSYKVAERLMAHAALRRGDRSGAVVHTAYAAALDYEYGKDRMPAITAAYSGRLPVEYTLSGGKPGRQRTLGIWRGNPKIREVALTFDDGPNAGTPALLDALETSRSPGTFMVVGIQAQAAPDILRRMAADGYEVEDHSYSHPNLNEAIPAHVYEEILRDAVIIRACTGIWPHFLRPPGGQANAQVMEAAQECGMAGAFWTIDALKAEDSGSSLNVVSYVLKHARPGAIILMHNGVPATTRAIPTLAAALRARGYRLVTLKQLALDTGKR